MSEKNPEWHNKIIATLDSAGYKAAKTETGFPVMCNYVVRLFYANEVRVLDEGDLNQSTLRHFSGTHSDNDVQTTITSLIKQGVLEYVESAPEKVFRCEYKNGFGIAIK